MEGQHTSERGRRARGGCRGAKRILERLFLSLLGRGQRVPLIVTSRGAILAHPAPSARRRVGHDGRKREESEGQAKRSPRYQQPLQTKPVRGISRVGLMGGCARQTTETWDGVVVAKNRGQ